MLYHSHDFQKNMLAGASLFATATANMLERMEHTPWGWASGMTARYFGGGPVLQSALEVFAHAAAPRGKPDFGFTSTEVGGKSVAVREEIVVQKDFGQLKRFVRDGVGPAPKLLIVAPMSGHYATLLRGTVERMLPAHDVYITDWHDARQVPMSAGRFDLDDYIDYVIAFLEAMGPNDAAGGTHMLAVCQPSVPCFAAAAVMAADKNPCRPKTLTMMGGPIDTRQAPTGVNTMAVGRPHSWFVENVIATVPGYYPGAGRRVYPGFLQLAGFMSMNLGNHMMSHWEMFKHLVQGDDAEADGTKAFYDEYRAVCDMTAEFYLQTVDAVFQRHLLPKGELLHRGRLVDPAAIRDIAILAIEGERDDISGIGQTKAALDLAPKLPAAKKQYYVAQGAGHYGIFNGSKWRTKIAPVVEAWIAKHH